MEIREKNPSLLATLQSFEIFKEISPDALQWLIDHSEYGCYKQGDELFYSEEEIYHMTIIMSGGYVMRLKRGGKIKELAASGTGTIAGVLPFSRMKKAAAHGIATEDCCVLRLHKEHFVEMVNVSYELTQALVGVMSTRIRDFTQTRFQDEKLMALGKLSAGLAHELNNPASAMVRSSEELYKKIHVSPEKFKALMNLGITPEETDEINEILFSRLREGKGPKLSLMEREDRRDELVDWLEDRNIEEAEDIAETLLEFSFEEDDLEKITDVLNGRELAPIMGWIESTLRLEGLVREIRESADRIAALIKAIKGYSHMDQAETKEAADIHDGIESTLMILKHKLKEKQIQVIKLYDENLPKANIYVGEMNQVWTNLIVNAVDAMAKGGELTIKTGIQREWIIVEVTDNGTGIHEDIQSRIFEPFFTTKSLNEGTGLGLEIAKKIIDKHEGMIELTSQPGRTTFFVRLPYHK